MSTSLDALRRPVGRLRDGRARPARVAPHDARARPRRRPGPGGRGRVQGPCQPRVVAACIGCAPGLETGLPASSRPEPSPGRRRSSSPRTDPPASRRASGHDRTRPCGVPRRPSRRAGRRLEAARHLAPGPGPRAAGAAGDRVPGGLPRVRPPVGARRDRADDQPTFPRHRGITRSPCWRPPTSSAAGGPTSTRPRCRPTAWPTQRRSWTPAGRSRQRSPARGWSCPTVSRPTSSTSGGRGVRGRRLRVPRRAGDLDRLAVASDVEAHLRDVAAPRLEALAARIEPWSPPVRTRPRRPSDDHDHVHPHGGVPAGDVREDCPRPRPVPRDPPCHR